MLAVIKQLCSLLCCPTCYLKPRRSMTRCKRPITALPKTGAKFDFIPNMEEIVRTHLVELAAPPIAVLPDWGSNRIKSRPFYRHCDAKTDGVGATIGWEESDGSVRPMG